jgi:hypothetical protein
MTADHPETVYEEPWVQRVRVRDEDGGKHPDPEWAVLFHSDMDTWMPESLPERFRPRGRGRMAALRRWRRADGSPSMRGVWRPLALTVAVVVLGLLSVSVLSGPTSPAPIRIFQHLIGLQGGAAAPTPGGRPQVTPPSGARPPAATAPSPPITSPSPVADQPSAPPQGNAGSSPTSSPGGLLGLPPLPSLPPLLPTPTPPQPSPTPTPRKCIFIICL